MYGKSCYVVLSSEEALMSATPSQTNETNDGEQQE